LDQKLPGWLCRSIAVSVVYGVGLALVVHATMLYITYWSSKPITWRNVVNLAAASIAINTVVAFCANSLLDRMRRRRLKPE
jgi:formate/nitrite transporter FocA (FNT family)